MAADIGSLADAAVRMKARSDKSVGWPLAAIKAIEGSGIRHKPDVDRLKTKVLEELIARGKVRRKAKTDARR